MLVSAAGKRYPLWNALKFEKQLPRSTKRPIFFAALVAGMRQCGTLLNNYPAFSVEFRRRAAAETEFQTWLSYLGALPAEALRRMSKSTPDQCASQESTNRRTWSPAQFGGPSGSLQLWNTSRATRHGSTGRPLDNDLRLLEPGMPRMRRLWCGMGKKFDYSLDFTTINFRQNPELYRVGRGEQGVLLVEPYKSELLPLWRFRTPDIARHSASAIYAQFVRYRDDGDFVGMDMARKFLQMGYTRARRYANHRSGRKYEPGTRQVRPQEPDWETSEKAESARIFYEHYLKAKGDPQYMRARSAHQQSYG